MPGGSLSVTHLLRQLDVSQLEESHPVGNPRLALTAPASDDETFGVVGKRCCRSGGVRQANVPRRHLAATLGASSAWSSRQTAGRFLQSPLPQDFMVNLTLGFAFQGSGVATIFWTSWSLHGQFESGSIGMSGTMSGNEAGASPLTEASPCHSSELLLIAAPSNPRP